MDQQTLELFCNQLAHWADDAAESGRSPFRRAEPFFTLLTQEGEITPPLTLWINRDSFMAGALLFFPSSAANIEKQKGIACAEAIGLRHFVTWAPREIIVWEIRSGQAESWKKLTLTAGDTSSAQFGHTFLVLLEELKHLSIAGSIPPPELSPFYLANLCRLAYQSTIPHLAEAYRIDRAENGERSTASSLPSPMQQSYLLLLRLLALHLEDRLPPAIKPEGLDRALRFAVDTLPSELRQPLGINRWELPLPAASAVRLHHLNRRLAQLDFASDRSRCRRTVEILLADAAEEFGAAPPPCCTGEETGGETLFLYPDFYYPEAKVSIEIGPPPLLAFTALLRRLQEQPAVVQKTDLLSLGETPLPRQFRGKLHESGIPAAPERRVFVARLRLSWPNRRLPLPAQAPRWLYELLHLLGLAGNQTVVALNTPDWLKAPSGDFIFGLLREDFALLRLQRLKGGLQVHLRKDKDWTGNSMLIGATSGREVSWARLKREPASYLRLALDLPETPYSLLDKRILQPPEIWPAQHVRGISLFGKSSLGTMLWRLGSNEAAFPPRHLLFKRWTEFSIPLPPVKILQQLEYLFPDEEPTQNLLDRELASLLGVELMPGKIAATDRPRVGKRASTDQDAVAETIRQEVFGDGIPKFPEQYLYDHYRPRLIDYAVHGPLAIDEEFLGQFTLKDRQGAVLKVDGRETARALLLASFAGHSAISLPADPHLTASLLERYQKDLHDLHLSLTRESHRHLHDPRAADALADKIWNGLPLPPWRLVDH